MSLLLQNTAKTSETAAVGNGPGVVNATVVCAVPKPDAAAPNDEKCPVIRAHRIMLSSATSGRLRVLFF